MDDWDDIIGGIETEKNEWDEEWFWQACEFGPMKESMT